MILLTNPETGYEKAHRQAEQIFREVFPAKGMTVREDQIRLCHTMLDAFVPRHRQHFCALSYLVP